MNKFISIVLCLSVLISSISFTVFSIDYISEDDTTDYIICTATEQAADDIVSDKDYDAEKIGNNELVLKASLTDDEAEEFEENTNIVYIEEDFIVSSNSINSGEGITDLSTWNLEAIGVEYAHNEEEFGDGVKIAVLDSGIDTYSEVLPEISVDFVCSGDDEKIGDDMTGHGTSVSGIIGAPDDNYGLIGIAPRAEIYNVRVLDGNNQSNISTVIEALYWCIENNVDIINMSFGTINYSQALFDAITDVAEEGILMVASAGNGIAVQYPAKFSSVIAVGSVNSSMEKSQFSPVGQEIEFVAPGENIYSTMLIGGYGAQSGTSLSAPHVTGAAAVLLAKDTSKSPEFIRSLLAASSKNMGNSFEFGNGIVDLNYALDIYDDFSYNYDDEEYTPPVNTDEAITFEDDDVFVVGQWNTASHEETIDYSYDQTSYNIRFPKYVKTVSYFCDQKVSDNENYKTVFALHGNFNYIVTAKLLYEIAANYKVGTPGFDHIGYRSDLGAILGQTNYNSLISAIDKMFDRFHVTNTSVSVDTESLLAQGSIPAGMTNFASINQKKSTVVFGMLFHLLGDLYAHRTIVPPSSLSISICISHISPIFNDGVYFVLSDFEDNCGNHISSNQSDLDKSLLKYAYNVPSNSTNQLICGDEYPCWGALERLAGLGVLQFKDIKYFLDGYNKSPDLETQKSKNNRAYYEDDPQFFNRRFLTAKAVTNHFFENYYDCIYVSGTPRDDDIVDFLPYYLLPIYSNVQSYKLKIDQYYNYLKEFHSGSSVLKEVTWQNRDDELFDYTTIVYTDIDNNKCYFIDPATYPVDDPDTIVGNDGKPKYYTSVFPSGIALAATDFYM